jgi:hypothetical protein
VKPKEAEKENKQTDEAKELESIEQETTESAPVPLFELEMVHVSGDRQMFSDLFNQIKRVMIGV